MTAESFLKERGVTRLCHFTKLNNLVHIIDADNGILASNASRPDVKDPKDAERQDGELNDVCCSIEYPNSWYLKKVQDRDENQIFREWVVIYIDLAVLSHRSIKFCPCNAAKARGKFIKSNISELSSLFASPNIQCRRRPSQMLTCCPTDDQAEILIEDNIPFRFINGLAVCCEDDAKTVYSMLRCYGKDVPIYVAPDVLNTSWSQAIRNGVRPNEVLCQWKGDL